MNPSDISNALIYGIPLISCIGYGYESLMACRGRLFSPDAPNLPSEYESVLPLLQRNKLRLAIAESKEQHADAKDLIRRRYAWRGYQAAAADGKSAVDRSAQEITFIVNDANATVGTVTLGLDGPHGLLAELTHHNVVEHVRAHGRKVCELTR